jgi:hypothetical protein
VFYCDGKIHNSKRNLDKKCGKYYPLPFFEFRSKKNEHFGGIVSNFFVLMLLVSFVNPTEIKRQEGKFLIVFVNLNVTRSQVVAGL